jgi:hypothetical protein
VVKTGTIERALAAFRRGANLPHFDKQSDNRAYSPQERKRVIFTEISGMGPGTEGGNGARIGLIFPDRFYPLF